MKVVEINQNYKTGSSGRIVDSIANELRNNGHECLVCSSDEIDHNEMIKGYGFRIGNIIDHKIHALLSRITGKQGYFSYLSTKLLIKKINEFNPDIIHLHNLHGNFINLKLLFSYIQVKRIPTVITMHDSWFITGKCTRGIEYCDKWKIRCEKCPLLHIDNVNPTFFFDKTQKCFDDKKKWLNSIENLTIINVSKWMKEYIDQSFLRNAHIDYIYNGVNMNDFYPVKEKKDLNGLENKFTILMCFSYLSEEKGYESLIYIAGKLKKDEQMIVIGKNPSKLLLPDNVIYIDYLDKSNLRNYYSYADVFVNASKFETFGYVTVEALACGTPVVMYDIPVSKEIINSKCGIIVKRDDGSQGLYEAIEEVKYRGKNYYTKNCVRTVKSNFSKQDFLKKYLDIFKNINEEKKYE